MTRRTLLIERERWECPQGYEYIWHWDVLATLTPDIPPDVTLYNEAFFCTHPDCGRIWLRRRWIDGPHSWWMSLKQCDQSPFSWYDFPEALASNSPALLETLTTEFLNDPSIAGYTGYPPLDN